MAVEAYAVVATVAGTYYGETATVGEVVNRIMWDGVSMLMLPAGLTAQADPNDTLPIGSTITAG